jgi:surface protein
MYQSCTYLYNKDELAQVKHPFGENIQTLGTIEELGYWQLEGAVGCETGLPYGSLSPHFAASYFEETHTPTLMVQCARGATTMNDWLPGTTQQRFEIAVEKTQKSIAAVEEIGRTIRGKYLVWLQGESDGAGTGVGTKKETYKTRFLQFWNAIKEQLGFEKCFIIRVHKFRDGYKYNCFPIIDAQEELALENDDIEMVTRVTGYLQYYDENPEHYTIQHAYQGLQIVSNHDHYTWEGYKLVGDTAGSRVGQYINTGVMPELEPEPWPDNVTSSSQKIIADYRFNKAVYENYLPQFNSEFANYRVADSTAENIVTRKVISTDLPTMIRFGIDCSSDNIEAGASSTSREQSLLEVRKVNMDNVNNVANMFCLCENLASIPALSFSNISNVNSMFYKCNALTSIDTRNYDLSQTVNADNFMRDCVNLSEIVGYENWNVGNMESMKSLFRNCAQLTQLDLSNFAMNNVVDISYIFNNCTGLNNLTLSNWNLEQCTNIENALANCNNLNMVIVNYSDYETINKIISALPVKTAENPGCLDVAFSNDFSQINVAAAEAKNWIVYKDFVNTPSIKIMDNLAKIMYGGNSIRCICIGKKNHNK